MEYKLVKKLDNIESEISSIKTLILSNYNYKMKKPVSFRGIAKTKLSEKELDKSIEESEKSLFKGI